MVTRQYNISNAAKACRVAQYVEMFRNWTLLKAQFLYFRSNCVTRGVKCTGFCCRL